MALAAFIVLAAFLSVLADLGWPAVVGVTALALAIAATVEWLAWQTSLVWPSQRFAASRSAPPASEPSPEPPPVVYAEPPADEPPTESESVGAGLVPPANDREPESAPRERRVRIPQIRRRPSDVEPTPQPEERPEPQLRAVESPPPAPEPEHATPPPPAPQEPAVVRMSSRRPPEPQEWNLWDLEAIARQEARLHPARRDEWSYLFVHLRQFADVEGTLPSEFDALVRESFGEMLEARNLV
jgi:hypothetical protein